MEINTLNLQNQSNNTSQAATSAPVQSVRGLTNILDALVVKGIIAADQAKVIKFETINNGKDFEQVLLDKNLISEKDIARLKGEMKNVGFVDIVSVSIPSEVLGLLKQEVARENVAVVFESQPSKVKVAMKDPLDLQKVKYLESFIGKRIEAYYASASDILRIVDTRYGAQLGTEVDQALQQVGDSKLNLDYSNANLANENSEDAPIIKIVNMILDYAIKHKASDIHIEPRDQKVTVRFRIRGVLYEKLSYPVKLSAAVTTRIKIISNLKIDEHRIPQDGRFQVGSTSSSTDIRVSIMPSIYGEKIVMRVLEKSQGIIDLEQTGLRGSPLMKMKDSLSRTQGIVLVTGPTGSGKTQTLASSLKLLNSPQVNIITLEDPVEIRIDGVNQVQVNSEVGLTFASGLRSILRQDPDVIMVGEIRDQETAALAVQAALIGRLVLATIHTNSAAGAFIRLIDMGIEPFLLTSTVNIVVAQRLVRTLTSARKPYQASPETVIMLHKELDPLGPLQITQPDGNKFVFDKNTQNVTLFEPVATPSSDSGYESRTGIFEALKISDNISKLIMNKASIKEIHEASIREGMITMAQDGFIKAMEGITTLEEVLRVRNE